MVKYEQYERIQAKRDFEEGLLSIWIALFVSFIILFLFYIISLA